MRGGGVEAPLLGVALPPRAQPGPPPVVGEVGLVVWMKRQRVP